MNSFFNTDANAEALRTLPINDDIVNRMVCLFDGTPQYYEAANADSFDFASTKDWSVSFWWNRMGTGGGGSLIDNRNIGSNDGIQIRVSADKILLRIEDNGGSLVYNGTFDVNYDIGTGGNWWYHIVVVWKGTLATPVCEFYLNGFLVPTNIISQNIAVTFTGNLQNVKYGQNYNNSQNWEGNLKDLSVWGTALDLDKVRYIYNRGVPNNLNETGWSGFLYHWYRFGDGSGGAGSDNNTQIIDVSTMGIANLLGFTIPVANCPKIADPAFLA